MISALIFKGSNLDECRKLKITYHMKYELSIIIFELEFLYSAKLLYNYASDVTRLITIQKIQIK